MKNQVIESLTREHGEMVIKYWQSQGVDTGHMSGSLNKADGNICRFYGVINGKFSGYTLSKVEASEAEIIELPDVSRPVPGEIHEALARIESKLDQLLAEKVKPEVLTAMDFKVGDKVRVKSWKEIKAMTTEDEDGDLEFDDGGYFVKHDKGFCGMEGVVISTSTRYVTTKINAQNIRFHYKALEKI